MWVKGSKKSKLFYIKLVLKYIFNLSFFKYLFKIILYKIINSVHGLASVNVGINTNIHPTVIIRSPKLVFIGDNCFFNHNTILNGGKEKGKLVIGNNVQTGPNVSIYAYNHHFSNKEIDIMSQGYDDLDVLIEDDVWIGAHSVILPGVKIGKGSVIGAGSIVTKNIPSFSIAVGNPAKVVKNRD